MSFIAKWINEYLLSSNKITQEPNINNIEENNTNINYQQSSNQITVNNTDDNIDNDVYHVINDDNMNNDSIIKWFPNNDLFKRYNKFINNVAELNRQKHSLETKIIPRSKQLIKEYMALTRSSNINDKIMSSEIKKKMFIYEQKIKTAEESIKKLELIDSNIIKEWDKYLEEGQEFLKNNNINSNITINDILSDSSLYLLSKKIVNGYCTNINTDIYLETIKDVKKYFDISSFKNTISISLKEYEEKKNKLLELEKTNSKNSMKLFKEAPHIFLRDINNNPIEYDFNINSNPIDITSDKMTYLDEEIKNNDTF
jgi:hypothetical protein